MIDPNAEDYVSPAQQTRNRIDALLAKIDAVLEGYKQHRERFSNDP